MHHLLKILATEICDPVCWIARFFGWLSFLVGLAMLAILASVHHDDPAFFKQIVEEKGSYLQNYLLSAIAYMVAGIGLKTFFTYQKKKCEE